MDILNFNFLSDLLPKIFILFVVETLDNLAIFYHHSHLIQTCFASIINLILNVYFDEFGLFRIYNFRLPRSRFQLCLCFLNLRLPRRLWKNRITILNFQILLLNKNLLLLIININLIIILRHIWNTTLLTALLIPLLF